MNSTLYVCSTAYHVFITVLKGIVDESRIDICIDTTIPDHRQMAERLMSCGLFGKVLNIDKGVWRHKDIPSVMMQNVLTRFNVSELDPYLSFLTDYQHLYLYNDMDWVGQYCNARNVPYHLVEDGLDCFRNFDTNVTKSRHPVAEPLVSKLFGVAFDMGQSKSCLDVEVNDASTLKTSFDCEVYERPRRLLLQQAKEKGIDRLLTVFNMPDVSKMNDGVLILTLPNDRDGRGEYLYQRILPQGDQVEFCRRVMGSMPGHAVFIKPHPRDDTDYSAVVDREHIIDRHTPAEMLLVRDDLRMYAAVAYMSTAVAGADYAEHAFICDERIADGNRLEYLSIY